MSLVVTTLTARAGNFRLDAVSLAIPDGAYGVVIGPAGAGKTTLLETIAGLLPAVGGTVVVGGVDVTHRPPERRDVGLVYQHAYLFPHLTAGENVRYATEASAASEIMRHFGIGALEDRDVRTLSGGERQLVALARALAARPAVCLLDEPFAALDPRTRARTRHALRELHRARRTTILHVTHDFAEAGMLGDVALLLEGGRVLQHGPPVELFRRPVSPFVAEFLGAENVFAGIATPSGGGAVTFTTGPLTLDAVGSASGPAHAVIRADEIVLSPAAVEISSARNRFAGVVTAIASAGALTYVTVDVDGLPFVAAVTTRSAEALGTRVDSTVSITFKATAVHLC